MKKSPLWVPAFMFLGWIAAMLDYTGFAVWIVLWP